MRVGELREILAGMDDRLLIVCVVGNEPEDTDVSADVVGARMANDGGLHCEIVIDVDINGDDDE